MKKRISTASHTEYFDLWVGLKKGLQVLTRKARAPTNINGFQVPRHGGQVNVCVIVHNITLQGHGLELVSHGRRMGWNGSVGPVHPFAVITVSLTQFEGP